MSHQGGLTLVELMVTLAVAILLLAVGIPLFQGVITSSRSVAQTNALVDALNLARSEAVKRGTPVVLCPKATPTETDPAAMLCGTAAQWTNGWIAFTDAEGTNAGVYEPGNGETVLRFWEALPPTEVINTTATSIRFRGTGELLNPSEVILDLYPSGCTGDKLRRLKVSEVGQTTTTNEACP